MASDIDKNAECGHDTVDRNDVPVLIYEESKPPADKQAGKFACFTNGAMKDQAPSGPPVTARLLIADLRIAGLSLIYSEYSLSKHSSALSRTRLAN